MPVEDVTTAQPFVPSSHGSFVFDYCSLDASGHVELAYAIGSHRFVERIEIPINEPLSQHRRNEVAGLLSLLHWVAGVSYYKAAAPPRIEFSGPAPGPAAAALLEALYSEGLGEFAVENLEALPRPRFHVTSSVTKTLGEAPRESFDEPLRTLVPIGGGKDSVVAAAVLERSGRPFATFAVGDAAPIRRTASRIGTRHLVARRHIAPELLDLNGRGALNGHVPVTAIVSCIALLTAALNGISAVAMANERSASSGNFVWDGVEINHQFSKGLQAERLLRAAAHEQAGPDYFSVLRPASELAIAAAFARMTAFHGDFTSCNAVFRIDPELRESSWCCGCPKCRFVFLVLAPFLSPDRLVDIFGADLLADEAQFEGFALLVAAGGHKPFECVGEEEESAAAIRLLAASAEWRDHAVIARLADEVLPSLPDHFGRIGDVLELDFAAASVPFDLIGPLREILRP